jgi:hypothetical protein
MPTTLELEPVVMPESLHCNGTNGERDPELVARVRSVRGRFKRNDSILTSDELHEERRRDKAEEEQQIKERLR